MNPSKKGWLKKYLQHREQLNLHKDAKSIGQSEEQLYRLLQPTGIMYGHPLQHPLQAHLNLEQCDPKGLMKLILTESFLIINSGGIIAAPSVRLETRKQIPDNLNKYYQGLYPFYKSQKKVIEDPLLVAESIINQRLKIQSVDFKSYLTTFFHNSLLFLDVFYYNRWVNGKGDLDLVKLKSEKEEVRFAILKVMAAAAQSDYKLQRSERAMFKYFMESANLTREQEKEANRFLKNPPSLAQLKLPVVDSWILRKYLLEMAILITWADKEVTRSEKDFLRRLSAKLLFPREELENSLLAVESFILQNWTDIRYLLGKQEVNIIRRRYVRRLKRFVNKNKEYVIQEIHESKELVFLMNKSRSEPLTAEEKVKVSEQLIDILKTVPTFVIIALPFTFITLPILLSLLPKSAFPSAFQE